MKVNVAILNDASPADLANLLERYYGFEVDGVLDAAKVVSGSIADPSVLNKIEGIAWELEKKVETQ